MTGIANILATPSVRLNSFSPPQENRNTVDSSAIPPEISNLISELKTSDALDLSGFSEALEYVREQNKSLNNLVAVSSLSNRISSTSSNNLTGLKNELKTLKAEVLQNISTDNLAQASVDIEFLQNLLLLERILEAKEQGASDRFVESRLDLVGIKSAEFAGVNNFSVRA